ncbi:MAG: hypothetical protein MRERV_86c007 [Mycoplasmataceae bacterium RV_VA103A]|nr:MAG: hypothetical protein MRERV_86c007 [Mycoplasmataceae bacterium RV_VA103A]
MLLNKVEPIKLLKKGGQVRITENFWESWGKHPENIGSSPLWLSVKKSHFRKKEKGNS